MKKMSTPRPTWVLIACTLLCINFQSHSETPHQPVNIPYDCPELAANIGASCIFDGDYPGIVNSDCECELIQGRICEDFRYYLSDHSPEDGISDIYEVVINDGYAYMQYIASSPIEVHIAFNPIHQMLYAVSKHENSYRALDPSTQTWHTEVALGSDYGEITAAVFNHDGKLLIGSQTKKMIYSVDVNTNAVSTYDTYAPVYGGDLAFASDGMLFMATRNGNGLYEVWSDPVNDQLIAILPPKVTGMAITRTEQLMISAQGNTALVVRNKDGSDPAIAYDLILYGEPYTLRDGDLASGCADIEQPPQYCDYHAFLANHGPGISGSDIYTLQINDSGIADLTLFTNVDFETHIAYNPDENLLYLINADGSFIRTYDLATASFFADVEISGNFDKITAAVYSPADGLLYVGDQTNNQIHSVNPTSGIATVFADAPVSGGDLEVMDDGTLYLGAKDGDQSDLYHIVSGASPNYLGSTIPHITGMARDNDFSDSFLISAAGVAHLTKINATDGATLQTYPLHLDGVSFTPSEGDMASGCYSPEFDQEPPVSPITAIPSVSTLTTYPNPTQGPSKVVFKTDETSRTQIEVYDMNGRNVATLFNQETQQGEEYTIDFNGSTLPNGVYIYRMTTNKETIIKKFMIAR